jgi:hypothetical protein
MMNNEVEYVITSETVTRFLSGLVVRVQPVARFKSLRYKEDHPFTSSHNIGNVEFFLIYTSRFVWTISANDWRLKTVNLEYGGVNITFFGDERAYTRDMTMLMMAADMVDDTEN